MKTFVKFVFNHCPRKAGHSDASDTDVYFGVQLMTKNLIHDTKSTELEKKRLSKYAQSQSLSYTTIAVFFP